jgi:hypothetical protein
MARVSRRNRPSPLLLAPLALLGACAGPKVFTNQDPAADFAAYRSYGFAAPLGTDDEQYSSLLSVHLKAAVARELEARGYVVSPDPDLLVNFRVQTQEKVQSTSTPAAYHGYRHYGTWGGYAGYETTVSQYTEGTLQVDLVDARRRQLVWEASLVGRITDERRENLEATCDEALREIFARYPHRAGAAREATAPAPAPGG